MEGLLGGLLQAGLYWVKNTYEAPLDHFPSQELDVSLVLVCAPQLGFGEDVL